MQLCNKISVVLLINFLFLFVAGCSIHRFTAATITAEQQENLHSREKAEEYFVRARDFERRGLDQLAGRYYEDAFQLDPDSKVLRDLVIEKYLKIGKYTQALLLIKRDRTNDQLNRDEKRLVSTIYIAMGEVNKAANVLESISGKSSEELFSLARIYESLGNIPQALSYYSEYFKRQPKEVMVGFKLGKMLLYEKKYDEAESLLVAMEVGRDVQPDIYTLRGAIDVLRGDTLQGLSLLDSALAIDSLHEEALRSKGQIAVARKEYSVAITCYEKLYHLQLYGDAYGRTLALIYYYNKQYDNAADILQELLKSSIDDYELHYYLGLVFSAQDKNEIARIELEKALALQGNYEDAWRELCYLSLKEHAFDQALAITVRYTRALPGIAASWRLRGYVENILKQYKSAVVSLKKAVALDSADASGWFELGSAYERNKEINRAVVAFKKVLTLRPGDPVTSNYLGYMWAERGERLDSAKVLIETALQQDPHNGAFLDSYGWVFYQMGQYDSALVYIKQAMESSMQEDPVLYCHLGDVLVARADLHGAYDAYEKSLELDAEESLGVREKIVELEILLEHQQEQESSP